MSPIEYQQHAGALLAAMAGLRRDAAHCDVLLQSEDMARQAAGEAAGAARGVWAHRAVLAAASPYLHKIFDSSFEVCSMQVIVIKEVEMETLQALVENIYSPSPLAESVENALALLSAATMLAVDDVRAAASDCLARSLSPDNVLGVLAAARRLACHALVDAADHYVHEHGECVLRARELLELAPDELAALLDDERLAAAARAEDVLDAALRWTQHRPQERRRHLESLLRCVRLSQVPRAVLVQRTRAEPLASHPLGLRAVVLALVDGRQAEGGAPLALLVVGGVVDKLRTGSALAYRPPRGRWEDIAALPTPRAFACAAVLDDRVYVIGGDDDRPLGCSVLVWDAATGSWAAGPALGAARRSAGAVALGGRLYVVGGRRADDSWLGWLQRGLVRLDSAEALDPREGVWRPVARMAVRRGASGVAALGGRLYVVGGFDGDGPLDSTERYDPAADRWETLEAMAERRQALGAAAVDGALYAVGGSDGANSLRTVERYRAGAGWERAPPLPASRYNAAVTARDGRLYVVGGCDEDCNVAAGVWSWSAATAVWSELPALPAPRHVAAAVAVAWPPSPAP